MRRPSHPQRIYLSASVVAALCCSLGTFNGVYAQLLYTQEHIDFGIPPASEIAFFSSQLQSHPNPLDDERARVWDNFMLATDSQITGIEWTGAYDGRFNRNDALRGEVDFLVQLFGSSGKEPDLADTIGSWILDAGTSGNDDGADVSTAQVPNAVSAAGGLVYRYNTATSLDIPELDNGRYWIAITAIQTFPSPNPLLEPLNPDSFFDPIWGWHLGEEADRRSYQFDAIIDSEEPGRRIRRDFSFSILGNPLVPGDFDNNGLLDDIDIDLLSAHVREGGSEPLFDVNGDGNVDNDDRRTWIFDIFNTFPGDATLDREVNFDDFLVMANRFAEAGGWGDADFDGDGFVLFEDFLLLAGNFGEIATASPVPEPGTFTMLILGGLLVGFLRKRN